MVTASRVSEQPTRSSPTAAYRHFVLWFFGSGPELSTPREASCGNLLHSLCVTALLAATRNNVDLNQCSAA